MPQLYAFQPDGHGPYSYFVIAESFDDAIVRIRGHIEVQQYDLYWYRGLDKPFDKVLAANKRSNGSYTLTILNPGEVIDNDNS